MQRVHEDDLVGHVQSLDHWRVLKFPAIAQEDESFTIETPYGKSVFKRRAGEALHPAREPLEVLEKLRSSLGEYNFAGQYQQAPAPLEGGLVKASWFRKYAKNDLPEKFETILQSWDTASKEGELNAYSVCTTWGIWRGRVYLLDVFRSRLGFPDLKRAVRDQAVKFQPHTILIEDKGSGTSLIQELTEERDRRVKSCTPVQDKTMRLNSVTDQIENGSVFLPEDAPWLGEYLYELTMFPNGKYKDQADSTSQALDWIKTHPAQPYAWMKILADRETDAEGRQADEMEVHEKNAPPKNGPEVASPSGPVVCNPMSQPPKTVQPCTYYGPDREDPESKKFKRRDFPKGN